MSAIQWLALMVLAVVQGATEFLPVSSSGHLSLAHALLGLNEGGLLLDVLLHVGTLVAVIIVYRQTLARLLRDTLAALRAWPRLGWREALRQHPGARLALLVVAASVPTALIGLTLKSAVEGTLRHPSAVGAMLILTGLILWSTKGRGEGSPEEAGEPAISSDPEIEGLTLRAALLIGVIQGLAVIPGISRSGATIAAALWLKVRGTDAARFSFLLSIPAIFGALLLALADLGEGSEGLAWGPALLAAAVAAVVGYGCLRWLVGLLRRARFHHFAWYCWVVGGIALVLGLR